MWKRQVKFEVGELLGEGSQGRVYKALRHDQAANLRQTLAVKILHSKNAVAIWKKEFESLSRVKSPYCVQVFSFERLNGAPALILEFVDGVTLAELGKTCLLCRNDIEEILAQVQEGLKDLSRQNIFHGDLSPHNVLVDIQGTIRLLDFGLANGSHCEIRVTPEFAAPERMAGHTANFLSDLFSLGRLECFLMGQPTDYVDTEGWLAFDPNKRKILNIASNQSRRTLLGQKIRKLKKRQEALRAMHTQTLTKENNIRSNGHYFCCLLVLMLASSSASTLHRPNIAVLSIRSQNWLFLRMDGRTIGYAPVDIEIPDDKKHILEWETSTGRGKFPLSLQPGESRILKETDLTQ